LSRDAAQEAFGTAHREAIAASRDEGCVVVVEVEQADGKLKRHNAVQPPKTNAKKIIGARLSCPWGAACPLEDERASLERRRISRKLLHCRSNVCAAPEDRSFPSCYTLGCLRPKHFQHSCTYNEVQLPDPNHQPSTIVNA
jgi:hypothetical protein